MVEVKPGEGVQVDASTKSIGQVVLKRLITAEQVIDRLCLAADKDGIFDKSQFG